MKVEKFIIKACCGKTSTSFKINGTLSKDFLALLIGKGFIEAKNFTKAGILFAENQFIRVNGPFGTDVLNIICKASSDCNKYINDFEALLTNME